MGIDKPMRVRVQHRALLKISAAILSLISASISALAQGEPSPDTKKVLSRMDEANRSLTGLTADVKLTKVTVVVNDISEETGKLFHKRGKKESKTKLEYLTPESKSLLIEKGKVFIYEPRIKRLYVYEQGKNRNQAEFFLIGFGPSANLTKVYDVKFLKDEAVNDTQTSLLELTPKSPAMFTKILLWVDQTRWIPIQIRPTESSGDYLTIEFTNLQLNPNLPDKLFKLNTPSDVEVVKPVSPS
jgi:outer membrane lipoprotein-sorting protein